MHESVDVVVVGAGINGLSAAALLAKRGRRVLVLEAAPTAGGAIRTEQVTLPGFAHDLFAMNLGLFAGGPVNAVLHDDLVRHGLELVPSARPFCSLFPDGSMLGVQTDAAATLRNVAAVAPEDVAAWQDLTSRLDTLAPHLVGLLSADLPSVQAVRVLNRARRQLGVDGLYELARLALSSTRAFTEEHLRSAKTRALMASWGMHLDFAPDIPGGAMFSFLETMGGQAFGMVIGKGGAHGLVRALVAVIEENGGEVRCDAPVEQVLVGRDTACGVRLRDGRLIRATRAVVANLHPRVLAGLLPPSQLRRPQVAGVERFRPGLATMMIHLALDAPVPWIAADAGGYNYCHIGPYLDDMALAYTQAAAGRLPEQPTLVVGQPTVSDPSRAPEGKHVLWVQVRVLPPEPDSGPWEQVAEGYADHVLDLLEQYAPGLRAVTLGRAVLSPADLMRYNPDLVGGDSLGGSHHPAQFFFLRPVPGWGRHRSPVDRLFVCGASTWPGGGVGGASGAMVADAVG